MPEYSKKYWDECWKKEDVEILAHCLGGYHQAENGLIKIFKENQVVSVCDAACGFGAYSLLFASNGFQVEGFDISETSIKITCSLLEKYHIDTSKYKTADLLDTGYPDQTFDAVAAHAVLDHLVYSDAKKALEELYRITKKNGLIFISFDGMESEDETEEHVTLDDGSYRYTEGARKGMVFHYYSDEKLQDFLKDRQQEYYFYSASGERIVVLRKVPQNFV